MRSHQGIGFLDHVMLSGAQYGFIDCDYLINQDASWRMGVKRVHAAPYTPLNSLRNV